MNVLLIGGTGTISTWIVTHLIERGHAVTCFNRGRSGSLPEGVRQLIGDRSDRASFESALRAERFDAAIDMICFTAEDAASTLRALPGIGHLVHCSTVCVHGQSSDALPIDESRPLRPVSWYARGKADAEAVLAVAQADGAQITIVRPSTTFSARSGLLRQVARDTSWIDRIRKGLPLLVCDGGLALHQFMHADDAGRAFAAIIGESATLGRTYHLVGPAYAWAEHHRTAMRVLGREVELVSAPLRRLAAGDIPGFDICENNFAHHAFFDGAKLARDCPAARPRLTLESAMRQVVDELDAQRRFPSADGNAWEDRLIAAVRN